MSQIVKLALLLLLGALVACGHPLETEGRGDIMSSSGTRNCLQADSPCDNLVVGDYVETYTAVPADGHVFVGWLRCDNQFPTCRFNVPAATVRKYWGQVLPSLAAVFKPIKLLLKSTSEGGVLSQSTLADCTGGQTCVVDGSLTHGFDDVFTAKPNDGFRFDGWGTGIWQCAGSTYPCAITNELAHTKVQNDIWSAVIRGRHDPSLEREIELKPLFQPLMPGGFALGAERTINATRESGQHNSDIAALPGGGYVVVWASADYYTGGGEIFAQVHDDDGAAIGQEIRVSGDNVAYRALPDVMALGSDRFLVTWQLRDPADQKEDVFARILDVTGAPVTAVFSIETTDYNTEFMQSFNVPKPDGGFLIVWGRISWGSRSGSYGQHFNSAGQPVGTPVLIAGEGDIAPRMAYFSDGGYVIANSHTEGGYYNFPVNIQCFSPGGQLIRESVVGDSQQHLESLTVLQDESFVVTWQAVDLEYVDFYGISRRSKGVFARRYARDCTPQGDEILVNSAIYGGQYTSHSVATNDGGFVVAWEDDIDYEVFAQRFGAQGEKLGGETQLNTETSTYPGGSRHGVKLATLNNGHVAAVWIADVRDGNGYDVKGRHLFADSDGDLIPDHWEIAYGLDPAFPYDALQDKDGDGKHNLDEFRSGGNPLVDER